MDDVTLGALKMYEKNLNRNIEKTMKKINREHEKIEKTIDEVKREYPTVKDVYDAYGYGVITANQKYKILGILQEEEKVRNEATALSKYLEMLKRDLKAVQFELNKF